MTQAILLAEDSPDDELLFKRILQRAGVLNPIYVVRDGDEAIAYLKGEGAFADRQAYPLPAVLFLDMKMPRVHGFEVLQWIGTRPDLKGLLIIALSHFGETREISRAYALGARTFLSKPLTQADVDNLAIPFRKYWLLSTASGNSHNPNKDAGGVTSCVAWVL